MLSLQRRNTCHSEVLYTAKEVTLNQLTTARVQGLAVSVLGAHAWLWAGAVWGGGGAEGG